MDVIMFRKSTVEAFDSGPNLLKHYSWFSPCNSSFYLAVGTSLYETLLLYTTNALNGLISGTLKRLSDLTNSGRSFAPEIGLPSEYENFIAFSMDYDKMLKSPDRSQLTIMLQNSDEKCRALQIGMKVIFSNLCPIPEIVAKILNDEPLELNIYQLLLEQLCSALSIHIELFELPGETIKIHSSEMNDGPILHLAILPEDPVSEIPELPEALVPQLRNPVKSIRFGVLYSNLHLDILLNGKQPTKEALFKHPYYFAKIKVRKGRCADCGNLTQIHLNCPNHGVCNRCRCRVIALGFNTCEFKGCKNIYNESHYQSLLECARQHFGEEVLPVGKYTCFVCEKSLALFTRHCNLNICQNCCRNYGHPCKYSELPQLIEIREFECCICLETLNEPFSTPCGHYFCQACAVDWFSKSSRCPNDNQGMTISDLKYASDIAEIIEEQRNNISAENALIQMMCWKALNKNGSYFYLTPYLNRYFEDMTIPDPRLNRLREVCDWACKLVNIDCSHNAEKFQCDCTFEHCLVCLKIVVKHANKKKLPLLCFCGIDISEETAKRLRESF